MTLYPGILYYVSYTVIMCLILLNFLLGIIIDAFIEVKEKFQTTKSVVGELNDLTRSSLNAMRQSQLTDAQMGLRQGLTSRFLTVFPT
jgi:hypothetical protein